MSVSAAKEYLNQVDYSLTTLAKTQLDGNRAEMKMEEIQAAYQHQKQLRGCLQHSKSDCLLTLKLMFHLSLLPLTKELSTLSGSLWNRTLLSQRAQRIDMLLLHSFHNRKFLLPERQDHTHRSTADHHSKGPQYSGGLVLDPKSGLYDSTVLLMDFNSLYPSIIMEYKLCFTTVDRSTPKPELPGPSAPNDAPLPSVIRTLIERRRSVKDAIAREKNVHELQSKKTREKALKLTANSMYGCLGFQSSRFYCRPLAELITGRGRDILKKTVEIVSSQLDLDVIYGDTDSIMVHTGSHDYAHVRREIGESIKRTINKDYKYIRIDIDGIYEPMLLMKKKKYAAIKLELKGSEWTKQREEKGLDIVRRDWSGIAKHVGNDVLDAILSGRSREDVAEAVLMKIKEVKRKVEKGEVPVAAYTIVKELSKHPEEYGETHNQPHVSVALRRKKQGYKDGVQAGQTVSYVICLSKEGTSRSLTQRAYHLNELENDAGLRIDTGYYLEHQVHPVVSRLCEPVEGITAQALAASLGLDESKYRSHNTQTYALSRSSTLDRCQNCRPLTFAIDGISFPFCGVEAVITGQTTLEAALKPPNPANTIPTLTSGQLTKQAILQTRACIDAYYDAPCKADEDDEDTTRVPRYAENGTVTKWTRHITEKELYDQLTYFMKQLDVEGAIKRSKRPEESIKAEYISLKETMDPAYKAVCKLRNRSEYASVNFKDLLRLKKDLKD